MRYVDNFFNVSFNYYFTGNLEEHKSYIQNLRSRALKFFKNAAIVGNYLTGFAVYFREEGTTTFILTEDRQHVKSYILTRKNIKLKLVRSPSDI